MHSASNPAGWWAALALTMGCAGASTPTVEPSADPTVGVTPVYRGHVFDPERADGPAQIHYERRVRRVGEGVVATHDTHDGGGDAVIRQTAWHDEALRLRRFESVDAQTASVAVLTRDDDGTVTMATDDGRRVRARRESVRGPLLVGPTLFPFVRAHWSALLGGAEIEVRFADVARRRTYPFVLRLQHADADEVVITFGAQQALVRWAVPTMRLTFDPKDRTIRRYEGRVPPKVRRGGRLRPFDARVEYERVVAGR